MHTQVYTGTYSQDHTCGRLSQTHKNPYACHRWVEQRSMNEVEWLIDKYIVICWKFDICFRLAMYKIKDW